MSLKQLKKKVAEQRATKGKQRLPSDKGIGEVKKNTKPKVKSPERTSEPVNVKAVGELPMGYHAVGKNDLQKLQLIEEEIRQAKLVSIDYETNGDVEDSTEDPQDHDVVGISVSWQLGQTFYLPILHKTYGANWNMDWLVENFLKPILEDPEIIVIAHNVKAEHQWSLLYEIDMFPKTENRKIIDTMVLIKQLVLPETVNALGEVQVGLKPATKALLADKDGYVHGLLHVDEIESFKDTVKTQVQDGVYKSGKNQGKPKYKTYYRTFDEMPVDQYTVNYACSDADWALGIYLKCMEILTSEGLDDVFFELNVPFMMVLGEYELAGWRVNPQKLKGLEKIAHKALYGNGTEDDPEEGSIEYQLQEALIDITANHTTITDKGEVLFPAGVYGMGNHKGEPVALENKKTKPFSWGSTGAKQWLFFHVLKLDVRGIKRSKKTGLPSMGADEIDKLIESYEGDSKFMKVLNEKAKYDKIMSTYVNGLLPYSREDTQKLHTQLNLVSTWRLSSKKPNLQNIPRGDNDPMGVRRVFEAPTYDPKVDYSSLNICTRPVTLLTKEGLSGEMFYVGADYSQIELRVLAWFANEANMIQAFIDEVDLHSKVAKDVFKLDCEIEEVKSKYKPFRYRAKKVNFGLVYGMTEYGLSGDPQMGMTVREAEQFIEQYMATYPGVKRYANEQIAFARENGYVQTMFGNRRPIPEINNPNKWIRQKGDNKAMNTPIQGSASDIIRIAMTNIRKRIPSEAPFFKAIMQIHDEIQGETPIEYAVESALFLKDVMETPVPGFTDIMPIVAEPEIGKIWGDSIDLQFDGQKPYVSIKKKEEEQLAYVLPLYDKAGIEVRIS